MNKRKYPVDWAPGELVIGNFYIDSQGAHFLCLDLVGDKNLHVSIKDRGCWFGNCTIGWGVTGPYKKLNTSVPNELLNIVKKSEFSYLLNQHKNKHSYQIY